MARRSSSPAFESLSDLGPSERFGVWTQEIRLAIVFVAMDDVMS
jgi:hypothetical protein